MRLSDPINVELLLTLGAKASRMLSDLDFRGLAQQFGYVLAYGRDPAEAIQSDYLRACESPFDLNASEPIVAKYFEPNSSGLFALVECFVLVGQESSILMELVVTGNDDKFIMIEEISGSNP